MGMVVGFTPQTRQKSSSGLLMDPTLAHQPLSAWGLSAEDMWRLGQLVLTCSGLRQDTSLLSKLCKQTAVSSDVYPPKSYPAIVKTKQNHNNLQKHSNIQNRPDRPVPILQILLLRV